MPQERHFTKRLPNSPVHRSLDSRLFTKQVGTSEPLAPRLRPQFTPALDFPGGWYASRYFGHRVDVAVWCAKPRHEHVRSQAERDCAFRERDPGADDEVA
jgi:hypothetical protein